VINKILVLVLVCILVFPLSLSAKEKRGADLEIEKKYGPSVRGELITVKQNSLLLLSPEGADVSVLINDVVDIKIVKKSKALLGASIGLVAGATAGALYGAIEQPLSWGSPYYIVQEYYFAAIGAGIGLLIGGLGGAALTEDEKIQVKGKSDSEIQEILEKLRKKARVPDYN
jgi:hypothetical protein